MRPHFRLEPVARLWRLAWPLIIANIFTPLLGLADAAIAGHLDQAYYLATVTVGAELLVIFFGTFSFLRSRYPAQSQSYSTVALSLAGS